MMYAAYREQVDAERVKLDAEHSKEAMYISSIKKAADKRDRGMLQRRSSGRR